MAWSSGRPGARLRSIAAVAYQDRPRGYQDRRPAVLQVTSAREPQSLDQKEIAAKTYGEAMFRQTFIGCLENAFSHWGGWALHPSPNFHPDRFAIAPLGHDRLAGTAEPGRVARPGAVGL